MGTDAYGWVEIKDEFGWTPLIQAWPLMSRNYDLFGSLFWTNRSNFRPIAQKRGMPGDCSLQVKRDFAELVASSSHIPGHPEEYFGCTWITWREIQAIDWEEEAEVEPYRVWVSETLEGGKRWKSKGAYQRSWLAQKLSLSEEALDAAWNNGQIWEVDGKEYEAVKAIKRKDALSESWQTLFKLMEVLAEKYGADGVRLVVWFVS
ncbi:MAG TPA: hypothetical protein VFU69_19195 [Ktedonobacterales bacterium]|nr:hypothetical protein [Ktedonobacterales bacterium]